MRPTARRVRTQVREHLDAEADYERGRQGLEEVRRYGENEAHLAEQSGLHHAADWPRMAEAWGCALGPILPLRVLLGVRLAEAGRSLWGCALGPILPHCEGLLWRQLWPN